MSGLVDFFLDLFGFDAPELPKAREQPKQGNRALSLSEATNPKRPGERALLVLGTLRVIPDFASNSYHQWSSELSWDPASFHLIRDSSADKILYQSFTFGPGSISVSYLKAAGTPITSLPRVFSATARSSGPYFTLEPDESIYVQFSNILLTISKGRHSFQINSEPPIHTDPSDEGTNLQIIPTFTIRNVGTTTFLGSFSTPSDIDISIWPLDGAKLVRENLAELPEKIIRPLPPRTITITLNFSGFLYSTSGSSYSLESLILVINFMTTNGTLVNPLIIPGLPSDIYQSTTGETFTFSNSEADQFGRSLNMVLPVIGLDSIAISCLSITSRQPNLVRDCQLDSILCSRLLDDSFPRLGLYGIIASADQNLHGDFKQLTALCRKQHHLVNEQNELKGSTTNPADVFYDLLKGERDVNYGELIYGYGLEDFQIGLESLRSWHSHCSTNNLNCNAFLEGSISLSELLDKVAEVGEAKINYSNNKFDVYFDRRIETSDIQFSFGEDDILENSLAIQYPQDQTISELKIIFSDEAKDYEDTELSLILSPAPSQPKTLEILDFGITNLAQANRKLLRTEAQLKYKQKKVEFSTSIQGLNLVPGDFFYLTATMPGWVDKILLCEKIRDIGNFHFTITASEYSTDYFNHFDPL